MVSKVFWVDVRCDDYSPTVFPFGSSPRLMAYAAASFRLAESVLLRMLLRWLPSVLTLMDSFSAISRSILPAGTSPSTSTSRWVNPSGYAEARTGRSRAGRPQNPSDDERLSGWVRTKRNSDNEKAVPSGSGSGNEPSGNSLFGQKRSLSHLFRNQRFSRFWRRLEQP